MVDGYRLWGGEITKGMKERRIHEGRTALTFPDGPDTLFLALEESASR